MSFGNGREAHVNGRAISQGVEASMHESLHVSLCQSSVVLGHGFGFRGGTGQGTRAAGLKVESK